MTKEITLKGTADEWREFFDAVKYGKSSVDKRFLDEIYDQYRRKRRDIAIKERAALGDPQ